MKSIWQKFFLCALLCGGALIANSTLLKKTVMADGLLQSQSIFGQSDRQNPTVLASTQERSSCQSLGAEYRDFYNFQTRNYYISICAKGEAWFYYREAKSNPDNALLIPATLVFGGDVFKAVDRKVTYFVGTNSDGYYSSVMYGNNQMIFEPELLNVPAVATQETTVTAEGGHAGSLDFKSRERLTSVEVSNSNTDLPNSDLDTGYWRVCTEDRDDLHPYLNGWQKFIGQPSSTINEYASVEGHNFYHSDSESEDVLVETTDGLMVTLDVIQLTETVGSVCVKPIASF